MISFLYTCDCLYAVCVEENKLPVKYSKLFSDLSDAEIPLELLSIGTEIGEGTVN